MIGTKLGATRHVTSFGAEMGTRRCVVALHHHYCYKVKSSSVLLGARQYIVVLRWISSTLVSCKAGTKRARI